MKKIMVLGAGIYQVPLIKKAKEMGLYTIVVSIKGNYPGFKISDKNYYVDTTNYKKVLELARTENISAIVTTGSDVAMVSVGYVCEKLCLSGINYTAALKATDKALMKQCFIENDVSTASFRKIYNKKDMYKAFQELGAPVILKVVDKSGSRGIIRVNHEDELDNAYKKILPITSKPYILLEKFINGIEFGIDAFILNKKIEFVLPHEKLVYQNGETAVPIGHIFPYVITDKQFDEVKNQVARICKALDLDNCAVNIDAFLCGNEIFIIEAGARSGATGIPELISGYTGVDYYEYMISVALGAPVSLKPEFKECWISRILISENSGEIVNFKIPRLDNVSVSLDYEIGDKVSKFKNGPDRIGQIIIHGDNYEGTVEKMNKVLHEIEIDVR